MHRAKAKYMPPSPATWRCDLGGKVHDVEEAHDGGAVVGDGDTALVVVDELVIPSGAQRGPHCVPHRRARVDVAHRLRAPLRRVCALLEQDELRDNTKMRNTGSDRPSLRTRTTGTT
jgi:hypothetical protein